VTAVSNCTIKNCTSRNSVSAGSPTGVTLESGPVWEKTQPSRRPHRGTGNNFVIHTVQELKIELTEIRQTSKMCSSIRCEWRLNTIQIRNPIYLPRKINRLESTGGCLLVEDGSAMKEIEAPAEGSRRCHHPRRSNKSIIAL
jgi:hypothetical protein